MKKTIYSNISPLDHRYYLANKELFDDLACYLSEESQLKYMIRIETALLEIYVRKFFNGKKEYLDTLRQTNTLLTPESVYAKEEKSHHHINAIVECLKDRVPTELRSYVHLGATSTDIVDTAHVLTFRDASLQIIIPLLIKVELRLIDLAEQEAETVQIGRTHGQAAVPITVGYFLAEYVSRLGQSITILMETLRALRGKFSGAVGGHHASSLIHADPLAIERELLASFNLKPAEYSTQILPPEYLLRCLSEYNTAFGIIANLADDIRQLQRSEIGELQEMFQDTQVGSSTMPHKRNPWNSEHIKSMWKTFVPRVLTFYMDQISEHQRDLTNSASSRFVGEYLAGFSAAAARMLTVLSSIRINTENLSRNLASAGDSILTEPVYILLALAKEDKAHDLVRRITIRMHQKGITLHEALQQNPVIWEKLCTQLRRIGIGDAPSFFQDNTRYCGKVVELAKEICATYRHRMSDIMQSEELK